MQIRKRSILGMSHIPEDRHKHGLVLDYTLEDNLVLQRYFEPQFVNGAGFLKRKNIRTYAEHLIDQYDVRSGQGPITLARSHVRRQPAEGDHRPRDRSRTTQLLIAVQPTRGLDVGAIEYIHRQIVAQRDKNKAVSAGLAGAGRGHEPLRPHPRHVRGRDRRRARSEENDC